MGTLYLVRHGQASFGADDYDRLSDLGLGSMPLIDALTAWGGQYAATQRSALDAAAPSASHTTPA